MADSPARESLTARESDVLRLVALGQCNKSIARDLDITVGTVKGHPRAIFKLDAVSPTEAIGIAIRRGLIDEPMRSCPVLTPSRPAPASNRAATNRYCAIPLPLARQPEDAPSIVPKSREHYGGTDRRVRPSFWAEIKALGLRETNPRQIESIPSNLAQAG